MTSSNNKYSFFQKIFFMLKKSNFNLIIVMFIMGITIRYNIYINDMMKMENYFIANITFVCLISLTLSKVLYVFFKNLIFGYSPITYDIKKITSSIIYDIKKITSLDQNTLMEIILFISIISLINPFLLPSIVFMYSLLSEASNHYLDVNMFGDPFDGGGEEGGEESGGEGGGEGGRGGGGGGDDPCFPAPSENPEDDICKDDRLNALPFSQQDPEPSDYKQVDIPAYEKIASKDIKMSDLDKQLSPFNLEPNKYFLYSDGQRSGYVRIAEARRLASRFLHKDITALKENINLSLLDSYYKAYFDDIMLTTEYLESEAGSKQEHGAYTYIRLFLEKYFTADEGYVVHAQSPRQVNTGFPDFSVQLMDPTCKKIVSPVIGIHGKPYLTSWKNLPHNPDADDLEVHDILTENHTNNETIAIIEVKTLESGIIDFNSARGKSISSVLSQLDGYNKAIDFGYKTLYNISIRGEEMSFYIYVRDWHSVNGFPLKVPEANGFLCLYVDNKGVHIVPQYNTFKPQVITYSLWSKGAADKHAIHVLMNYIRTTPKVASIGKNLMLKELNNTPNPWSHGHALGIIGGNRIGIWHSGEMKKISDVIFKR